MVHLARIPATSLLLEVSGGTTHFCRHHSPRSIPPGSQEGSGPAGASDGRSGTSHRCCRCPTGWPRSDGTKDGSLKEAGNNGDRQYSWTKQSCHGETLMGRKILGPSFSETLTVIWCTRAGLRC